VIRAILEAKPVTATTSKLVYTLMWNNSTLVDDAARDREKARRRQMFKGALSNMKILAEGGRLPPRADGPFLGGGPGSPGGGAPAQRPGAFGKSSCR